MQEAKPARVAVTGSSGFVGHRLVEMLLERDGIELVVAFDLRPPTDAQRERSTAITSRSKHKAVVYIAGDITSETAVLDAFKDRSLDTVFHTAALVGPYHSYHTYLGVNYGGCVNVVSACKKYNIPRLVLCSTPSTRFTGRDITGQTEAELPEPLPGQFVQIYAETKAMGQHAVLDACCDSLLTVAVAPHQVYGPGDTLFIPAMLETAANGQLRVIGSGENIVSFCYVDNICHALILASTKLVKGSPILGQFYVVTDGEDQNFWHTLDDMIVHCGYDSILAKTYVPSWLTMGIAYGLSAVTFATGLRFKLEPFAVQMLVIHRYFSIEKIRRDMGYRPLLPFREAWAITKDYFKNNRVKGQI